jgi:hypothetical protein
VLLIQWRLLFVCGKGGKREKKREKRKKRFINIVW